MPFPSGVTVTLVRKTKSGEDRWHNSTYDTTSEVISGVVWVPMQTSESTQGAEQVIGNGQFYLPVGTVLDSLSEILFDGKTYQVQGDPEQWTSPFSGTRTPVRVNVREVTGGAAHSSTATSEGQAG